MIDCETSEFFHPLLSRFEFELVEKFNTNLDQHYLYQKNDRKIITTEGTFGAYWQEGDTIGSWAILENHLKTS